MQGGRNVLSAPDFRGNNFFNTFGNLAGNPSAGLLFVDFESGDVLTLTGTARVIWEEKARHLEFQPELGWWLAGAAPMRWSPPQFARQLVAV
jgi:hypothetical protein